MKRATNPSARSRSRKKTAAPDSTPALSPEISPEETEAPAATGINVDPLEGKLSVVLGILFVITALFPRSLKQLLTLSLGGGLLYRGLTGHCGVYQALGVDTKKEPILPQIKL